MGNDSFAVAETLEAIAGQSPVLKLSLKTLADELKERVKPIADDLNGDVGNYDAAFRDRFQQLVGDDPVVQLMDPTWSGQNHHLARADLAVRLLCQLDEINPANGESVLLWGHSHAGNGFAILSNLLANERESVGNFFDAAAQTLPHWERAKEILTSEPSPHPLARRGRIAAFGTPVRYGWDHNGCKDLIHVLHHRDTSGDKSITTKPLYLPHSVNDMFSAKFGDWIQAFGICGTDIASPTSSAAIERIGGVLESGLAAPKGDVTTNILPAGRLRNVCARWKTGTRCHTDGHNLLVDYEPSGRRSKFGTPIELAMLGHGVATTIDWLPTHLSLVLQHLSPAASQ